MFVCNTNKEVYKHNNLLDLASTIRDIRAIPLGLSEGVADTELDEMDEWIMTMTINIRAMAKER